MQCSVDWIDTGECCDVESGCVEFSRVKSIVYVLCRGEKSRGERTIGMKRLRGGVDIVVSHSVKL